MSYLKSSALILFLSLSLFGCTASNTLDQSSSLGSTDGSNNSNGGINDGIDGGVGSSPANTAEKIDSFIESNVLSGNNDANKIWQMTSQDYITRLTTGLNIQVSQDLKWNSEVPNQFSRRSDFVDLNSESFESLSEELDGLTFPKSVTDRCGPIIPDCFREYLPRIISDYNNDDLLKYIKIFEELIKTEGYPAAFNLTFRQAALSIKALYWKEDRSVATSNQIFLRKLISDFNYPEIKNVKDVENFVSLHGDKLLKQFFTEWSDLANVDNITKADASFTANSAAHKTALTNSISSFVDSVVSGGGSIKSFYTAPLDPFISNLSFIKDNTLRKGITHHPAFHLKYSGTKATAPTQRGVRVFSNFLCQQTPPVPRDIDIGLIASPRDGVTTRDLFQEHANNRACASCHQRIDPPGFALENFDELGNFRINENNKRIDASASMQTLSISKFESSDYLDFVTKAAQTKEYEICSVVQFLKYFLGRDLYSDDQDLILGTYNLLEKSDYKMKAVLEGLIRYRLGL